MKRNYIKPEVFLVGLGDIMDVIPQGSETNEFDTKKNDMMIDWDEDESIFKNIWAEDDSENNED